MADAKPLLDIVNEDDEVIGQATRAEVLEKVLINRLIHVVVVNYEGNMIVQYRGAHKDCFPLRFDAGVGGCVDAGETYEEAAKREMKEELGIEGELHYCGKYLYDSNVKKNFVAVYFCEHDGPYVGWEEEADALEELSMEEYEYLKVRFPYLLLPSLIKSVDICMEALGEKDE